MRITIITGSISRSGGGLFDTVRRQSQMLSQRPNISVQVLGLQDEHAEKDINAWLPVIPHIILPRGPCNFGYAPDLKYQLEKSYPVILHSHGIWMYRSIASMEFCSKNKVPYVISPHGMLDPWALNNSGWRKRIAGILYENRNFRGASCLHALNQAEIRAMREYGLKNPICQIPNGIDIIPYLESFEPPWRNVVEQGKKVLLFLGRIHPKKGLANLLLAWKQAQCNSSSIKNNWSLVIVGWDQGGHEEELKKMCKDLRLEKSVHFLGPLFNEQKASAYQNADAFILSSMSEGLPMSVLEAWAHKLPVLMTPHCNLPEGFVANAAIEIQQSPQSVMGGLLKLIDMNRTELYEMGENGLLLVKEKYNWEKITADLISVYNWVLGGSTPPSCVVTN